MKYIICNLILDKTYLYIGKACIWPVLDYYENLIQTVLNVVNFTYDIWEWKYSNVMTISSNWTLMLSENEFLYVVIQYGISLKFFY